jgi:hypothetical protein
MISKYLNNASVLLNDRGKSWLNIAIDANVTLPQTTHFKPPGLCAVSLQTVQRACKVDEGIINTVCEEEKELTKAQAGRRIDWIDKELPKRPHSENWKDVAFCNKFYFGIGPQLTKRIKRRQGQDQRSKPQNVYCRKVTLKDTKAKAQEEKHLKLLNVFVVIRYNY